MNTFSIGANSPITEQGKMGRDDPMDVDQSTSSAGTTINVATSERLLRIPKKQDYSKTTLLVNGSFQAYGNGTFEYSANNNPSLRAHRTKAHTYTIVDPTSNKEVAIVSKAWTNITHSLAYKLHLPASESTRLQEVELACMVYSVPSLVKKIATNPARQAHVAMLPTVSGGAPHSSTLTKDCHQICKKLGVKNLTDLGDPVNVFPSKAPSGSKGESGLFFAGRGKLASSKNMQLTDTKNRVIWQMSKYDEQGAYHVDFRAPLNTVQAFAVALCQYDL